MGDFVFASRSKSLKLRHLVRLYAKELVMLNFAGMPADQLLERMVAFAAHRRASLNCGAARPGEASQWPYTQFGCRERLIDVMP